MYYLGFWNKLYLSDIHIIYDDVTASKYDYTNRFKVKSPQGQAHIITLSTKKKNRVIINKMELKYNDQWDWRDKIRRTIKPWYKQAQFFDEVYSIMEDCLEKRFHLVKDFNLYLFERIIQYLGMTKEFFYSSKLGYDNLKGSERLACLTKKSGGSIYLSGSGGRNYIEKKYFSELGIKVIFQKFVHPKYKQLYGDNFIEYLSIIDLLFNEGSKQSLEIIKKSGMINNA